MPYKNFPEVKPNDSEYVLTKDKDGIIKLGIFMEAYRDDSGMFASNGFYNEDTCKMIEDIIEWRYIPDD